MEAGKYRILMVLSIVGFGQVRIVFVVKGKDLDIILSVFTERTSCTRKRIKRFQNEKTRIQ